MTKMFVAAGGGGDALAAVMLHAAAEPNAGRAIIATYAWDRLLVDPLPGPRGALSFTGLERAGACTWVVTGASVPIPPAGSTLPRLASQIDGQLILLDPYDGERGMAAQLQDAVSVFGADHVDIVDVGGDIMARGDEPGLKSPLADALVLAACADLPAPVDVLVAGLGLDGELPADYCKARIAAAGGAMQMVLKPQDIVSLAATFGWHPSEATGMLAAAIGGIRGIVEVRDAGTQIVLDDASAEVHRTPHHAVFEASLLAPRLVNKATFQQVEREVRDVCGFCETDYERAKADGLSARPTLSPAIDMIEARVAAFDTAAVLRGVDFATFRRLIEAVGAGSGRYERLRAHLIRRRPERYCAPLWSVRDLSSS